MSGESEALERAKYVSLATFRRSGARVATPVWAAFADGGYYVFSAGGAGKVKRLRNSSAAELAVCDVRGNLLGDWHSAEGRILQTPEEIDSALAALHQKYGLSMWIADVLSKLTGKMQRRAYLHITLR